MRHRLVVVRAVGPEETSACVAGEFQVAGDRWTKELCDKIIEAAGEIYEESFGERPDEVCCVALPWVKEHDHADNEEADDSSDHT